VLAGPVIGLLAVGLVRMIGLVSHYGPRGRWALVAPLGATLVLGVVGIWLPQLFGNGKGSPTTRSWVPRPWCCWSHWPS
jgi:CIC family chloride channel protein